jgi:hypothetical protein
LFDLQNFVGAEFDGLGDGVSVGGAKEKRAEDEEVERALEHFDAIEFGFSRHSRWRIGAFTSNVKGKDFPLTLTRSVETVGDEVRKETTARHHRRHTVGRNELLQFVEDVEVGGDTGIGVDVAFEIEREVGRGVVDEVASTGPKVLNGVACR